MDKAQQLKNLKKLQAIWAKKLKDSGFKDIENKDGRLERESAMPVVYQTNFGHEGAIVKFEATREYYALAGQFYHDYKFSSDIEKKIWFLHSQGVTARNIVKLVRTKTYKANKDPLSALIRRLAAVMLKLYRERESE